MTKLINSVIKSILFQITVIIFNHPPCRNDNNGFISQPTKYYYSFRGYFLSNSWINCLPFSESSLWINMSTFSSNLSSPSLDCEDPIYHSIDRPATCHINCRNSDCQFSIVSLKVSLK